MADRNGPKPKSASSKKLKNNKYQQYNDNTGVFPIHPSIMYSSAHSPQSDLQQQKLQQQHLSSKQRNEAFNGSNCNIKDKGSSTNENDNDNDNDISEDQKKRKRSSKACVICHQRKIKCDLDTKSNPNEKCSNCHELNLNCDIYKRKKRLKKYQIRENLSELIEKTKIDKLNGIHLDPSELIKNSNKEISKDRISTCNANENDLIDQLYDHFDNDVSNDFARSQGFDMPNFENLFSNGCFNLPERSLCEIYIDSFFNNIYPVLPIVDKESFLNENFINESLNKPKSLLLLQTILFVGSKNIGGLCINEQQRSTQNKITTILYKRAKALYDNDFEKDSVSLAQTLLLFGFSVTDHYFHNKSAFCWLQIAINVANGSGFFNEKYKDHNVINKVVWALYTKDRIMSMVFQNRTMVHLGDLNKIKERVFKCFQFDTQLNVYTKHFCIEAFKMCEIIEQANNNRQLIEDNAKNGKPFTHVLKQTDFMLGNWFNELPDYFKIKAYGKSSHNCYGLFLASTYFTALITIHHLHLTVRAKWSILKHPSDYNPSWGIIFQSSIMVHHLSNRLKNNSWVVSIASFITTYLFISGKSMIYYLSDENVSISRISNEIIKGILIALNEDVYLNSKFHFVLKALYTDKSKQRQLISCVLPLISNSAYSQTTLLSNNPRLYVNDQINFSPDSLFKYCLLPSSSPSKSPYIPVSSIIETTPINPHQQQQLRGRSSPGSSISNSLTPVSAIDLQMSGIGNSSMMYSPRTASALNQQHQMYGPPPSRSPPIDFRGFTPLYPMSSQPLLKDPKKISIDSLITTISNDLIDPTSIEREISMLDKISNNWCPNFY